MGTFSVSIGLAGLGRNNWITLDALVDTGASTTSLPSSLLRGLGIEPIMQQSFRFAQGEVRVLDIGQAFIRIEGQEFITQVVFNEEGTSPLLGALSLEAAYMAVNPVDQKLVPVEGLLMQATSQVRSAGGGYD